MTDYFAFYGTLMDDAGDAETPATEGLVRRLGSCRLAGILRDHGDYPGFFPHGDADEADGTAAGRLVVAELHELLSPAAFAVFDAWESYDPADEAGSMYVRRRIPLAEPAGTTAWVYVSQLSPGDPEVPGGDWRAHRASRTA
ncbi:gamma-glutamylcyclotransferase family protein [Aurantimonas sp. 22II-16-19i]|uniref:gamma-glutamylcyclotransferase family protein n=1 Tax=Aurantimonas sp. 22II-16-19i TaxID=1317114 RepID=UPI0009F7CC62|nr:gamma-glutamylcyclotransferase family protein [Aurantimonas sp. 22II-16-19i]ORE90266.1 AIG2 family protein [Aurantimonas sp. 22II-16-19i]